VRRQYLHAKPNAPSAFAAEVRLAVAEDRSCSRGHASNDLTFVKSEAAFELPSSRRRAVADEPRKQRLSKAYTEARQAVPTGEAHRLPKSVAYLSMDCREVKAIRAKKRDEASTSALFALIPVTAEIQTEEPRQSKASIAARFKGVRGAPSTGRG
jgi:hypothetical protein